MLQRAASNAYSWWWASHIRTKQSKWLEQNLQGLFLSSFIGRDLIWLCYTIVEKQLFLHVKIIGSLVTLLLIFISLVGCLIKSHTYFVDLFIWVSAMHQVRKYYAEMVYSILCFLFSFWEQWIIASIWLFVENWTENLIQMKRIYFQPAINNTNRILHI